MSAINKLNIKPSTSSSQCFVLQQGKLQWLVATALSRDILCNSKKFFEEMGQERKAKILDELYDPAELVHSQSITVSWKGKGGKVQHWNVFFF